MGFCRRTKWCMWWFIENWNTNKHPQTLCVCAWH